MRLLAYYKEKLSSNGRISLHKYRQKGGGKKFYVVEVVFRYGDGWDIMQAYRDHFDPLCVRQLGDDTFMHKYKFNSREIAEGLIVVAALKWK